MQPIVILFTKQGGADLEAQAMISESPEEGVLAFCQSLPEEELERTIILAVLNPEAVDLVNGVMDKAKEAAVEYAKSEN